MVISDEETMWCVPSVNGRILHAIHPELFVPSDEAATRLRDVHTFFDIRTDDARRIKVLERYGVRWIILNRQKIDEPVFKGLLVDRAVVRRDDDLVLMDAHRWIAQRSKPPKEGASPTDQHTP